MSYCRFSEGHVYLYANSEGFYECCGCQINDGDSVNIGDQPARAVAHLSAHEDAGHFVPDRAWQMLGKELQAGNTWPYFAGRDPHVEEQVAEYIEQKAGPIDQDDARQMFAIRDQLWAKLRQYEIAMRDVAERFNRAAGGTIPLLSESDVYLLRTSAMLVHQEMQLRKLGLIT